MTTFKLSQSNGLRNKYAPAVRRRESNQTPIQTIATEDDLRRPPQRAANGKVIRKTRSVDENTSSKKSPPNIPPGGKKNMADANRGRSEHRKDNGLTRQTLDQKSVKNLPPNSVVLAVFAPDDGQKEASDDSMPKAESRRSHRSRDDDSGSEEDDRRRRRRGGSTRSKNRRRRTRSKHRRSESSETESDSYDDDYERRKRHPSRRNHQPHPYPRPQPPPPPAHYMQGPPPQPVFMPVNVPARPPVSPPAYNRHQVAAIIEYLDQAKSMRQQQQPPHPLPPLPNTTPFGAGRHEFGRRRSTSPISMKPLGGSIPHPPDPAQPLSETDSDPEVVLEKFLSRRKAEKDKRGNSRSKTAHR